MHIKDFLALIALEMVMVLMSCNFVACIFSGQLNLFERTVVGQAFQVSVDSGYA